VAGRTTWAPDGPARHPRWAGVRTRYPPVARRAAQPISPAEKSPGRSRRLPSARWFMPSAPGGRAGGQNSAKTADRVSNLSAGPPRDTVRGLVSPQAVTAVELRRCSATHGRLRGACGRTRFTQQKSLVRTQPRPRIRGQPGPVAGRAMPRGASVVALYAAPRNRPPARLVTWWRPAGRRRQALPRSRRLLRRSCPPLRCPG